jgi:hypothetical protein
MTKTKFITQERETGTVIDEFKTYSKAYEAMKRYEEEDRKEGNYSPDFYEILVEISGFKK